MQTEMNQFNYIQVLLNNYEYDKAFSFTAQTCAYLTLFNFYGISSLGEWLDLLTNCYCQKKNIAEVIG